MPVFGFSDQDFRSITAYLVTRNPPAPFNSGEEIYKNRCARSHARINLGVHVASSLLVAVHRLGISLAIAPILNPIIAAVAMLLSRVSVADNFCGSFDERVKSFTGQGAPQKSRP